ncbi:MAG: protein kinase [Gemmatimonadota bacterium]
MTMTLRTCPSCNTPVPLEARFCLHCGRPTVPEPIASASRVPGNASQLARLTAALADHYRIERELGQGGMATVYLAEDPKHHRKVALKVLRPELAAVIGAERFLKEIETTANLQHPNILPLYDSGESDGFLYYVMPYVEGETLRGKLTREKQFGVEEALTITTAVAAALDYAHRHGVIHRDIKPENILLHDRSALVADFGIALAVSSAGGSRLTETGMSLGTPYYMSPEQAMGEREITPRSDIYALGCVLYEMLLGEPPFTGPTTQAIVARMLTEEPRAPMLQRKAIPPHVEQALLIALEKLPADRFESAAAFAEALQGKPFALPTGGRARMPGSVAAPAAYGRSARLLIGASVCVVALVAGAGAWAWLSPRGAPQLPVRFVLTLPPSAPLLDGSGSPLVLSPDGRTLAYRSPAAGSTMLYRRGFDQLVPTVIDGTGQADLPFISPDGKWVAFFTPTELKRVPIDGGPAATIARVVQSQGASWGPNNIIVLGSYHGVDGLSRVSVAGGQPSPFTRLDTTRSELSQRWPHVLADGKTVLYTSWGNGGLPTARIGIASLETGECTILDLAGTSPFGIVEGQLLYVRADGVLMGAPIDLRRRRITGDAAALVGVGSVMIGAGGGAKASLSETGALAYVTGSASSRLVLVGANGAVRALAAEPRDYDSPRFSPDGKRIAVAINTQPPDIWVYDIAPGTLTRLTSQGANIRPEWAPDGKRIAFVSSRSGENGVWVRAADGSAPPRKVFESRDDALEVVVAPDGGALVYRANQTGGSYGVWFRSLDDVTTPKSFFSTASFHEIMPSLSPDRRWLAYASDESGATEVYVRPFPGPSARYLVSAGGGSEPRWAPDGRRLFYRSGRRMLVAQVSTVPAFSVSGRDVLFEGSYSTGASHQNYDITPDGQGFLMLQRDADADVVVVLNWLTELRARIRAPAPK